MTHFIEHILCVIDSGIMEGHKYLTTAVDTTVSKSFLPETADVNDNVAGGGHGTRVAGAILYANNVPISGSIQPVAWLQNARVLDETGRLPKRLYPPKLMRDIIDYYPHTKIFNLSINYEVPCRTTHMSAWGAALDQLMWERDILFIISTGNLPKSALLHSSCVGVADHLISGRNYPDYLLEKGGRISNPAQSSFAITVGSISDVTYNDLGRQSISQEGEPSSFTKAGLGMWGAIKPDVVEYGGDLVRPKAGPLHLFELAVTSPLLVRIPGNGNGALGRDRVGTSFAAPKVSHLAAQLQSLLPGETTLMYRALIAQSSRLTNEKFRAPELPHLRTSGYGLPDINRAIGNSEDRVTLIASGTIGASELHLYSVDIPEAIRRPGDDFDVLVEVTLSYKAQPRRTRRRTQSYLSTWLDFETAKLDESYEQFLRRATKEKFEDSEDDLDEELIIPNSTIPWTIHARSNWGKVKQVKRQDSTLQKDWFIVKSFQLPDEFIVAIRGHKGWEKDPESKVPYAVVISFESLEAGINLYEQIRIANEIEIQIQQQI